MPATTAWAAASTAGHVTTCTATTHARRTAPSSVFRDGAETSVKHVSLACPFVCSKLTGGRVSVKRNKFGCTRPSFCSFNSLCFHANF